MKISTLRQNFVLNNYSKKENDSLFFSVLEYSCGISKIDYFINPNFEINNTEQIIFYNLFKGLKNNIPIQYLTHQATFMGLDFFVNPSVLIPRQETEELVHFILKNTDKDSPIKVLDIGTGSGCIAISLAKHLPNAQITALDFSKKALEVAQKNAEKHQTNIYFLQKDILKINQLNDFFDIIVSNPPYICENEKNQIHPNVLDNEPHTALFVPDENPLIFYDKIAELGQKNLSKNGKIFFEINENFGNQMKQMMKSKKYNNIVLKKDISNKDRILTAQL